MAVEKLVASRANYGRAFGFSEAYVPQTGDPPFISIWTESAVQLRLSLCRQSVAAQDATWEGAAGDSFFGWAMVCSRIGRVFGLLDTP